ncbi:hypothetical protein Drorol1_Dr00013785 [Drosera rotundifolia]
MMLKDDISIEIPSQNGLHSESQTQNKAIVESFYKALATGDAATVANLVRDDLEWWFHGPPQCQHMMRVLTGEADWAEFVFEPQTITAIDDGTVIAEGWPEEARVPGSYWVHVWTVSDEGQLVKFREYFNTWLTVRDLRPSVPIKWNVDIVRVGRNMTETLWQSQPSPKSPGRRSMPELVLAI